MANHAPTQPPRLELYDTTLRDGTQGLGVNLSVMDKLQIADLLDEMGFDFVEGGYPLSNPKDAEFFDTAVDRPRQHARLCAFGMTRRKNTAAADDTGMNALLAARTPVVTLVGKTWDLHVDQVLGVSPDENLAMIRESAARLKSADHVDLLVYDAEHFFDGYRANRDYALQTLRAAVQGGADRLVLCDTNGGSLPGQVRDAVADLRQELGLGGSLTDPGALVGIHCHNDAGLAVANSLAAVDAGAVHVQGTINGIGERCGNVDLLTVAANASLKLGFDVLRPGAIGRLTELSQRVYELAQLPPQTGQPYVGAGAFAHKGGMHVHAVQKTPRAYEHVSPDDVGNRRRIVVSELSGVSNVAATLGERYGITEDRKLQRKVLEKVQDLEHAGYQFEQAEASFELIMHDARGSRKSFWELDHYRCSILRRNGAAEMPPTEAVVKLRMDGRVHHEVAEGDGPVDALTSALRRCVAPDFPVVEQVHLTDYQVRVVNPSAETAAKVRVTATFVLRPQGGDASGEPDLTFTTIGVHENIVEASWEAISDAFQYCLLRSQNPATAEDRPAAATA
ncbi:MAG: citramalate synthase [Planctomycetota bacterium]